MVFMRVSFQTRNREVSRLLSFQATMMAILDMRQPCRKRLRRTASTSRNLRGRHAPQPACTLQAVRSWLDVFTDYEAAGAERDQ